MNKQQLEKIERVRARVIENQQMNDRLYDELISDLKLKQYSHEEEFLFDVVFNSSQQEDFKRTLNEFQKRIDSKE